MAEFDFFDWIKIGDWKDRQTCPLCGAVSAFAQVNKIKRVQVGCHNCHAVLFLNSPRSIVGFANLQRAVADWGAQYQAQLAQFAGETISA